jgi:hypothetical protein
MSLRRFPGAAALLALAACTPVAHTEGPVLTLRFAPLTLALVVAVPALALVAGGVLARSPRSRRVGVRLALLAGAAGVLVVPGILMDTVTVTPERVEQRTGFWFKPNVKGFRFGDVERIRLVRKRTGKHVQVIWELARRDGRVVDLDPGDLWEHGTAEILPRVRAAGIPVEDAAAP